MEDPEVLVVQLPTKEKVVIIIEHIKCKLGFKP
jgi:hypothetical protein